MSDFFEPPPLPPEPEREYFPPPWVAPPANVLGGIVQMQLTLVRNESLAVAVMDARAYPTGLEFTVSVRRRRKGRTRLEAPPLWWDRPLRGEIPPELLRFGVQFADGRKATSLTFPHRPDEEPSGPVLAPRTGSGGGAQWDHGFWLYPLPPSGPLAFVCEWPSEGIELTRQEVDAEVVREAAGRAEVLWEDEAKHLQS